MHYPTASARRDHGRPRRGRPGGHMALMVAASALSLLALAFATLDGAVVFAAGALLNGLGVR